jgi:hypothetical protein
MNIKMKNMSKVMRTGLANAAYHATSPYTRIIVVSEKKKIIPRNTTIYHRSSHPFIGFMHNYTDVVDLNSKLFKVLASGSE